MAQKTGSNVTTYTRGADGSLISMNRNGVVYYYQTNLQGDVEKILDGSGTTVVSYTYDAYGRITSTSGSMKDTLGVENPFRYRSYFFDQESGFYYLQSRYYDPMMGRFISADSQINPDVNGGNIFAYCGNNPVNSVDPEGTAWYHWVAAVAVVVVVAVAVVVTAGGAIPALAAIGSVAAGYSAGAAGITAAAAAFIGSAAALSTYAFSAGATSNSTKEFADQGNWGIVGGIAGAGALGAGLGLTLPKAPLRDTGIIKNDIIGLPRVGSALKTDPYHSFNNIVDNYAGFATKIPIKNGMLYQIKGSLNGIEGRFEWIVQDAQVTHRMFVEGGEINGIPILP